MAPQISNPAVDAADAAAFGVVQEVWSDTRRPASSECARIGRAAILAFLDHPLVYESLVSGMKFASAQETLDVIADLVGDPISGPRIGRHDS